MAERCRWHETGLRFATAEDWAWLEAQGERAWGEAFLSRWRRVCWEHDRCDDCDGRGQEYDERADEVFDCGTCAGAGALHRDCGLPASCCDCLDIDGEELRRG